LFAKADLFLLRESLNKLLETPYYNKGLTRYTRVLVRVVTYVLENSRSIPPSILDEFSKVVYAAHKYLRGSTTNEMPYELEFCLNAALREWTKKNYVITTALLLDKDFHFYPLDPWQYISTAIPGVDYKSFDSLLIQIALPSLYRDKPLFNIPLYHELGHFVDKMFGVTELSFIYTNYQTKLPESQRVEHRHRQEFFADIFAACYVGDANLKFVESFVGDAPASSTHPSVKERIELGKIFLDGTPNSLIDVFQQCLKQQEAPALFKRFSAPDVNECFDNIRPCVISDKRALHGIFSSSWDYLLKVQEDKHSPWQNADENHIATIINDLVEKSIRNYSIREKWANASSK
jgi:hypothetical protein